MSGVSYVALFIALGGTSIAAVSLKRGSVKGKHIAANAVSAPKVKNGSLLSEDFGSGQLPRGERGPAGEPGSAGERGPAGERGAAGSDAQFNGADADGDLTGTYPAPTIADGAVGPAKIAAPGGYTDAGLGEGCSGPSTVWTNLSLNANNAVSYYRDPYGTVHLRGVAFWCNSPVGNTIVTLPVGFRPQPQEVVVALYNETGAGRVDVNADGTVVAADAIPGTEWVSLDGITYRCAPSGSGGCP